MAGQKEIISSLVLILFGAVFLLYDIKYPLDELANPGPGVFPLIVGAVLVTLAALNFIQAFRKAHPRAVEREGNQDGDPKPATETIQSKERETKVLLMVVVFVAYLIMVKYAGFFISNFFFVIISSRFMGARNWSGPIALSVGINLFCYILFEVWLKVFFPRGILF